MFVVHSQNTHMNTPKRTLLAVAIVLGLAAACNAKKESGQTTTEASTSLTVAQADTVATATTGAGTTASETTGKQCFLAAKNRDTTRVSLTIEGDKVTGEMIWNPYQKDGAKGTLTGTKTGNTITADYNYMIEGNQQQEEKLFVLEGNKLLEKGGPLTDKAGKMVLTNPAKATTRTTLTKVVCP